MSETTNWNNIVPVGREFGSPDYDRLAELDHLAIRAKGSLQKARSWLETPNRNLNGKTPEEVAKTPAGFELVKELLKTGPME
jgi:uncharacterized protein (DUF2384 family)